MSYEEEIRAAVEAKLQELDGIAYGPKTGRRYQLAVSNAQGTAKTPEEHREMRRLLLTDIAERLGLHFFQMADTVLLDQLVTVSVIKNHDTAGLLKSLINSFLIAYTNGETTTQAYQCLQALEMLRAMIEKPMGRTQH